MHYLFDLDGTLTDPGLGITNSILYALKKLGKPCPAREALFPWIGPPLYGSFMKYAGCDANEAQAGLDYYREYFGVTGLFENKAYDGIAEMLAALKRGGHNIYLATSKPEEFAVQILEHFGLLPYFDLTVGNTLDEARPTKEAVIRHLRKLVPDISKENALMIGDREMDVEGAHAAGLPCVGVLYGYGSRDELEKAGADYIAEDIAQLGALLGGFKA